MKNLVRGGVILSLIGLFVVFIYAQTRTETALNKERDSQLKLNNNIESSNLDTDKKKKPVRAKSLVTDQKEVKKPVSAENSVTDDKKLVKKTVLAEKAVTAATGSAAANKGSFTATAYCLKGRTAMGHGVRRGIIAGDPRVLRLGSRVNLGAGAYSGQYLVSDTGGKIKGRKIDIWVPSCAEARRFGRRTVQLGVLGK
ncbi:MAG: 3D domain-containing protein [Acidobacteriota bacterium]